MSGVFVVAYSRLVDAVKAVAVSESEELLVDVAPDWVRISSRGLACSVSVKVELAARSVGGWCVGVNAAELLKVLTAAVKGLGRRGVETLSVEMRYSAEGLLTVQVNDFEVPLAVSHTADLAEPIGYDRSCELALSSFIEGLKRVAIAAEKPSANAAQVLTCVKLSIAGEHATLAATDRYRIARLTLPLLTDCERGPIEAIVPAKKLANALKLFSGETLTLGTGHGWLVLSDNTTTVELREETGGYPRLDHLLALVNDSSMIETPLDGFRATIDRAAALSKAKNPSELQAIYLTTCQETNTLQIIPEAAKSGPVLPATIPDDAPAEIKLNASLITEGVQQLTNPTAALAFTQPGKPIALIDDTYTYMMLPMR